MIPYGVIRKHKNNNRVDIALIWILSIGEHESFIFLTIMTHLQEYFISLKKFFSELKSFIFSSTVLDFDFEKLCSISLSHLNVYACMVCGKYFQVSFRSIHD